MTNNLTNVTNKLGEIQEKADSLKKTLENKKYIIAKIEPDKETEVFATNSLRKFIWFVLSNLTDLIKQKVRIEFGDSAKEYLVLDLHKQFKEIGDTINSFEDTVKISDKNITQLKNIAPQRDRILNKINAIFSAPSFYALDTPMIENATAFEKIKSQLAALLKEKITETSELKSVLKEFEEISNQLNRVEKQLTEHRAKFDEGSSTNFKNHITAIRKNLNDQLEKHPSVKQLDNIRTKLLQNQKNLEKTYTALDEKIKKDPLWKKIGDPSSLEKYRSSLEIKKNELKNGNEILLLELEISSLDSLSEDMEELAEIKIERDKIAARLKNLLNGDLKLVEEALKNNAG